MFKFSDRIWNFLYKPKFWVLFQFLLFVLLFVIGSIRGNNFSHDVRLILEFLIMFAAVIVGFPLGVFYLYDNNFKFLTLFITSAYYIFFALFLFRILPRKTILTRIVAVSLLLFMVLSFAGCSRVINFFYT